MVATRVTLTAVRFVEVISECGCVKILSVVATVCTGAAAGQRIIVGI